MIDFGKLPNFSRDEFPQGIDDHCSSILFAGLQAFRAALGRRVMPSPLTAGWFRPDAEAVGSRHYCVGRKSDAGDIFPEGSIVQAWRVAVSMGFWGGVGVYYDTSPGPMLNLDLRPTPSGTLPLWWCRVEGKYYYPSNGGHQAEMFFGKLHEKGRD